MTFEMTQDDITNAHELLKRRANLYKRSLCCPVAVCLRRVAKTAVTRADPCRLLIGDGLYPTPENVRQFIYDFDANLPVSPITFELNV